MSVKYLSAMLFAIFIIVSTVNGEDENPDNDAEISITFLHQRGEDTLIFWNTDQKGLYCLQSSSNLTHWVEEDILDVNSGTHQFISNRSKQRAFLRVIKLNSH